MNPSKPQILIVDDQPKNLVTLKAILQPTQASIIKVGSGREALEACETHEFALAILDIHMPEMDGYELAERLRHNPRTCQVPIIFITGTSADENLEFKGYEAGAVDFLRKPASPMILIAKANVFLELYEQRRKLEHAARELAARNEIANIFLTVPDDEMYAAVLELLLVAMESMCGIFGYINESGDFVVPSMTSEVWSECQVPDKTFTLPRDRWGGSSWSRAIREQRTICLNEPSKLTPEGHIPISRHIAMPIIHHGAVIGVVQVANKDTDYSVGDIALLEALGGAIAAVLDARLKRERHERQREQAEQELQAFNASMVDREMRTVEVKREVNALAAELGREPPYPPVWEQGEMDVVPDYR